jgi:hypothetical protein
VDGADCARAAGGALRGAALAEPVAPGGGSVRGAALVEPVAPGTRWRLGTSFGTGGASGTQLRSNCLFHVELACCGANVDGANWFHVKRRRRRVNAKDRKGASPLPTRPVEPGKRLRYSTRRHSAFTAGG